MWFLGDVIILLWLMILSLEDGRTLYIKASHVWPAFLVCGLYLYDKSVTDNQWQLHLLGVVLGMVFLLISKCTKEKLGYGDSVVLLILGMYLGIWEVLSLCTWAFILCFFYAFCYALYGTLCKKDAKGKSLPFLPFILVAYMGVHMMDYIVG